MKQETEQKLPKAKWGGERRLWERLLMGKNLGGYERGLGCILSTKGSGKS